jgi:hypothetical protein
MIVPLYCVAYRLAVVSEQQMSQISAAPEDASTSRIRFNVSPIAFDRFLYCRHFGLSDSAILSKSISSASGPLCPVANVVLPLPGTPQTTVNTYLLPCITASSFSSRNAPIFTI